MHTCAVLGVSSTPGELPHSEALNMATRSKKNTVFQIMRVVGINKNDEATVIWDSCSSGRFVKESYAQKCRFKSRQEMLTVVTLEGKENTFLANIYQCYFHDLDGERYTFKAYGLETVTREMGKLNMAIIKALFPGLLQKELNSLQRKDSVDYHIGYEKPS